ncbi:hypothetical protein [Polaribacter sp.]|uniref:hypothetical protein n=1 Tax=Polaribacter sp. TaxID=1920175 RepID=UPI003F6B6363
MKIVFPFLLLLLLVSCSKNDVFKTTQNNPLTLNFVTTFGGSKNDVAQKIINTNDKGYAILGHSQSTDFDIKNKTNESFDYWLLKFDAEHTLEWSKTFGGTDDDRGRDLVQTNDNGFLITGFSRSSDGDVSTNNGNYDFWTVKLNESGAILWEKSFGFLGSDQAYTLKKTSDNGFLIGGSLDVSASGGQGNAKSQHAGGDFWLIKIDANGNKIWSRYYGGLFTDSLYDLVETDNGNFILVGSSDSSDTDISNNIGSYDFWVVKIDKNGAKIWEKNFGGSQPDEAFAIEKTNNNEFLIAGNTRSTDVNVTENAGSSDIWLIKINADGELLWEKTYGGSNFEIAKNIKKSKQGGFYIVGSSRSADFDVTKNEGNKDVWIIKIDENGTLLSENSIGGSELDEANDVIETENNGIILVGESWSNDKEIPENKGFSDVLIINLN